MINRNATQSNGKLDQIENKSSMQNKARQTSPPNKQHTLCQNQATGASLDDWFRCQPQSPVKTGQNSKLQSDQIESAQTASVECGYKVSSRLRILYPMAAKYPGPK